MVLKKKQDYGFNGFHISTIPRAPRSVRRRGSVKKPVQDSQICAIDLLATLAGKLLRESESSSASSNAAAGKDRINSSKDRIKQELQDDDKPLKGECLDPGSCEGIVFVSELASQSLSPKYTLKQFPYTVLDTGLDCTSTVASPDYLDKVGCDVKIETSQSKSIFEEVPCKVERGSPDYGETCGDLGIGTKIHQEAEVKESESLTMVNRCHSKDSVELCMRNPAQINSDSNVKLPLSRGSIPNASFPKHRDDVKIGNTDDDEKSYRCKQHSTKIKAFRPSSFIGDQRIRKLLTSRYWKVAPKLKGCELSNTDGGIKPVFRKRKTCGMRKRYQRQNNFKRRKLFERCMVVASDGGVSSESVTNSPEKIMNEKDGSAAMLHGGSGLSSSVVSHQASFNSGDSHVKFSIKSFRVPELFIEVPETATIGVLKRTVMEAVNSIFGGGLHVGMFLQGKKVRDDYRTLRQTGISHNDNLDSLGFALEPSHIQSSPPLHTEDPPLLLPSDTSQLLTRSPDPPTFDSRFSDATPDPSPMTNLGNQVMDKTNDSVPSPTDVVTDKTMLESKPLVSVPAMSLEALAVVPMNMKTNRSDIVQRRTRRPFSVSEVEALVHAVEELGTGRWRDVKLRAFDNAKHRTYVDLKDKWKTLVHTARISPQQRRGEPVPQELLDRVLCAHAYWCERQAKQNGKHQVGTPRTTGPLAERDGIAQDV